MRTLVTTLTLLFIFSSNSERNRTIAGLYGECKNGYLACDQLLLNKDSTFKYGLFYDVGGWKIWSGRWKVRKDTLILNSYNQPNFKLNSVIESQNLERDFITIQIFNIDQPAINASIEINDGQIIKNLDLFGVAEIHERIKLRKIKIHNTNWSDCVLKDSVFLIKNENTNNIEIHTQPLNSYLSEYFVDLRWLIKGNKIFPWHNWTGAYTKSYSLKRTQIERIQFDQK